MSTEFRVPIPDIPDTPEPEVLFEVSPPWAWILLTLFSALMAMGVGVLFFGRVEVHGRGRSILQPRAGVRVLQAQAAGILHEVHVRNGDLVVIGTPLLTLEALPLQSNLLETERQIQLLSATSRAQEGIGARLSAETSKAIQNRIQNLQHQLEGGLRMVRTQTRRLEATRVLMEQGLVSVSALDETQDMVGQAQHQVETTRQALAQTEQELASVRAQQAKETVQREQELQTARIRRETLLVALSQTVLRAPVAGTVEGIVAKVGESIQAGVPLARILPSDSPLRVVSLVLEPDRPFIKPGDPVALELDAYPYAEFGTLEGRVVRLGQDLATPQEIEEAFGIQKSGLEPAYRVEIEVLPHRPKGLEGVSMRPGMLLQARFVLRRQRLLALVFNPLAKWFH